MTYDLLVVGSGPVGSTFARVVAERLPDARILLVEAGLVLTDPPGLNLKNLDDEAELAKARELRRGRPARVPARSTCRRRGDDHGAPGDAPARARKRGHARRRRVDMRRRDGCTLDVRDPAAPSGPSASRSSRSTSSTLHSTRRSGSFHDDDCRIGAGGGDPGTAGRGVRRGAAGRAKGRRPSGRRARRRRPRGLDGRGHDPRTAARPVLELRPETLCRRLVLDGGRVTGVELESRRSSARRSRRRSSSQPTRSERRSSSPRGSARPPSAATSPSTPSRSPSSSSTRSSSRRARSRASSGSTRCYP